MTSRKLFVAMVLLVAMLSTVSFAGTSLDEEDRIYADPNFVENEQNLVKDVLKQIYKGQNAFREKHGHYAYYDGVGILPSMFFDAIEVLTVGNLLCCYSMTADSNSFSCTATLDQKALGRYMVDPENSWTIDQTGQITTNQDAILGETVCFDRD